jgi:hypothetical protein
MTFKIVNICSFAAVVAIGISGISAPASAVPSYSDQTGDPCSACHVGSFGPQLTPHGRQFKLSGYSDGDKKRVLPLVAGMVETSFTHTAKGQEGGAAPGFHDNNNIAVDQVSLFLAGRIYDHIGVFSQTTWDGVGHHFAWDNTDLRYGNELHVGGVDSVVGVSLNNSPTLSDPYNTTSAWGFPWSASHLAATPAASTMIDGGLAQRVAGVTAYALVNDLVYVEAGGYHSLSAGQLHSLGAAPGDGPVLNGVAPYWRLAVQQEMLQHSFALGTFGMISNVYPNNDRSAGTDRYTDIGFDASYQWHASKRHTVTANASAVLEDRRLSSSVLLGGAENEKGHLNSYKMNASYYYDQTYGLTLGAFKTTGSADAGLYAEDPIGGSANGKPNSTGFVVQADWTPFGKEDSWGTPWANLRLALQYTGYTRFNGLASDYDGNGRKASDNNTLWFLTWVAF